MWEGRGTRKREPSRQASPVNTHDDIGQRHLPSVAYPYIITNFATTPYLNWDTQPSHNHHNENGCVYVCVCVAKQASCEVYLTRSKKIQHVDNNTRVANTTPAQPTIIATMIAQRRTDATQHQFLRRLSCFPGLVEAGMRWEGFGLCDRVG